MIHHSVLIIGIDAALRQGKYNTPEVAAQSLWEGIAFELFGYIGEVDVDLLLCLISFASRKPW